MPKHIFPLVVLIYICLISVPELSLTFSGLNLTIYRVGILLLIIPAIAAFLRSGNRLKTPDIAVLVGSIWMIVAFLSFYEPGEAFVRAIGIVVDAAGAYFIGRTSIRSYDDFRRVLILTIPGFFASGVILAVESITHSVIYRSFFQSLFGSANAYIEGNAAGALAYRTDSRLGLLRAYSTYSHPILAGVTLASLFPMIVKSGLRGWPRQLGIAAAFLGFFSLSSVTMLLLAGGAAMLITDKVKNWVRFIDWRVIVFFAALALFVIHIVSESGVVYVIIRYTFDPHNGFVRIIQWEAALEAMRSSPWFGIGYQRVPTLPEWLPNSIDAQPLALALRSGWITSIAFYIAPLSVVMALGLNINRYPKAQRDLIVGLNFSLILIIIGSFTVAFFGETNAYVMTFYGMAAAFTQFPRVKNSPAVHRYPGNGVRSPRRPQTAHHGLARTNRGAPQAP